MQVYCDQQLKERKTKISYRGTYRRTDSDSVWVEMIPDNEDLTRTYDTTVYFSKSQIKKQ